MIGEITVVSEAGVPCKATLSDTGLWTSALPDLADYLNTFFDPLLADSPANGPFAASIVQLAAKDLDGSFGLSFSPVSDPERVY